MHFKYYVLSDWSNQPESLALLWADQGRVEVQAWDPNPTPESGILGYLRESEESNLPVVTNHSAPWIVFGSDEIVRLDAEVVKCPGGVVLYTGDQVGAAEFVALLQTNTVQCDFLGHASRRTHMLIGGTGESITTGQHALVIAGAKTQIFGGDQGTLIGGRHAKVYCGTKSIISVGRGAEVTAGSRATVAGDDLTRAYAGHSSTVVGGYKSNVTGQDLSTVVGGYKSTVCGGYGATVVGGEEAVVKGGDYATVIGGDDAWVQGGDHALVFGGLRSKVCGGIDATLRIAHLDGRGQRSIATGYVGRGGIRSHIFYSFDGVTWQPESMENNDKL